jgi:hypothetical protein
MIRYGLDFWNLDKEQRLIREILSELEEALNTMKLMEDNNETRMKKEENQLSDSSTASVSSLSNKEESLNASSTSAVVNVSSLMPDVSCNDHIRQVIPQVHFLQTLWQLFTHPSKKQNLTQNMQILVNLIRQRQSSLKRENQIPSSPPPPPPPSSTLISSSVTSSLVKSTLSSPPPQPPQKTLTKNSPPNPLPPKSNSETNTLSSPEQEVKNYMKLLYRLIALSLQHWCDGPKSNIHSLYTPLRSILRTVFTTGTTTNDEQSLHTPSLCVMFFDNLLLSVRQHPHASIFHLVYDIMTCISSSSTSRL